MLNFFRKVAEERLHRDLPEPPRAVVEVFQGKLSGSGLQVHWGRRKAVIHFIPERSLWYLDIEKEHVEGFDRVLKNLRRHWTLSQSSGGDHHPGPNATEVRYDQMRDEGIRE